MPRVMAPVEPRPSPDSAATYESDTRSSACANCHPAVSRALCANGRQPWHLAPVRAFYLVGGFYRVGTLLPWSNVVVSIVT